MSCPSLVTMMVNSHLVLAQPRYDHNVCRVHKPLARSIRCADYFASSFSLALLFACDLEPITLLPHSTIKLAEVLRGKFTFKSVDKTIVLRLWLVSPLNLFKENLIIYEY